MVVGKSNGESLAAIRGPQKDTLVSHTFSARIETVEPRLKLRVEFERQRNGIRLCRVERKIEFLNPKDMEAIYDQDAPDYLVVAVEPSE